MAEGGNNNWRWRDRTQLFKEEIIIGGCVTGQQFKLFHGDVVRVSAEITEEVNYSAYDLFQKTMTKHNINGFVLHKKLKKKGFFLQRIVKDSNGRAHLVFDVNDNSLPKLEKAIQERSLGHILLSSITGKKDGNKVDGLELKLDDDEVKTARNNLNFIEKYSKKLYGIYRQRTLAKLKRTRSVDGQVEDNPTFPPKRKRTSHGKENASRVKIMGDNNLENRPPSRSILENLANNQ